MRRTRTCPRDRARSLAKSSSSSKKWRQSTCRWAARQMSRGVKISGMQSERAPSYVLSWKEGRPIETETCDTIADGLATRMPVAANVAAIRELVDDVALVSEEELLGAIGRLLLDEHVVAEPAGAAATAAFLKSKCMRRRVVLLVTGANISKDVLRKAAEP